MNQTGTSHLPYDPQLKDTVIKKIRDGGMSAKEASDTYQVPTKSIYRWLRTGVVNHETNLILENNRLKKELEQAYALLGRATANMQRPKS